MNFLPLRPTIEGEVLVRTADSLVVPDFGAIEEVHVDARQPFCSAPIVHSHHSTSLAWQGIYQQNTSNRVEMGPPTAMYNFHVANATQPISLRLHYGSISVALTKAVLSAHFAARRCLPIAPSMSMKPPTTREGSSLALKTAARQHLTVKSTLTAT